MTRELECARDAAKKAGDVILTMLGKVQITEKESNFNLVTTADTASQQIISNYIHEYFPEDLIFGEENDARPPLDSERIWIIDPIDGTTNFAHRIPHFSISVAFAQKGIVQCGVVLDPSKEELFSAQRGSGAWCNDQPISVSAAGHLTAAVICTGFYYERGPLMLRTIDSLKKLFLANIQGIRRTGSAALDLCYVASGRFDGYYEYRLSTWDFAAGILIAQEAGAACCDSDGVKRNLFSRGMICCTPALQKEFLDIVCWPDLYSSS